MSLAWRVNVGSGTFKNILQEDAVQFMTSTLGKLFEGLHPMDSNADVHRLLHTVRMSPYLHFYCFVQVTGFILKTHKLRFSHTCLLPWMELENVKNNSPVNNPFHQTPSHCPGEMQNF